VARFDPAENVVTHGIGVGVLRDSDRPAAHPHPLGLGLVGTIASERIEEGVVE
jgi:hypothetical protein